MIAPNVATAAARGDKPPAAPAVVASNLKWIAKHTLQATVDLTVPRWRLMFRGCLWHEKGGKEWIAFPAREWTDSSGAKKYANLAEFTERATADRFQIAALAAAHQLAARRR